MQGLQSTFFARDNPRRFRNLHFLLSPDLAGSWTSPGGGDGYDKQWVYRLPPQVVPRVPPVPLGVPLRLLSRGSQLSPPGKCGCDDEQEMIPR